MRLISEEKYESIPSPQGIGKLIRQPAKENS